MKIPENEKNQTERIKKTGNGLTGAALKWIAVITMIIDHIGAVIIYRGIYIEGLSIPFLMQYPEDQLYDTLSIVYFVMRKIGRIAFPVFCFLLVEGFLHTGNRKKYAIRLLVFALISEIPFNLAIGGEVFYPKSQNVIFTLLIGFCVMAVLEKFTQGFISVKSAVSTLFIVTAAAALSYFLQTDYSGIGVVCIVVIYLFRYDKNVQNIMGAVIFLFEIPASLAFIFIYFYNGERGKQSKYFFYIFYPGQLLLLWLIVRLF